MSIARLQRYVCAECFADPALREYAARHSSGRGCSFCGDNVPAAFLEDVAAHMRACLELAYGGTGGVARPGTPGFSTTRLLKESVTLELPRDPGGRLFRAICRGIGKGPWHEGDHSLRAAEEWRNFREIFLGKRRFFLDGVLRDSGRIATLEGFFQSIADTAERRGLCVEIEKGTPLYRARWQQTPGQLTGPEQVGPPLPHQAVQANRMNPPGIPYFYASDSEKTALAEIGKEPGCYAMARFETQRSCRILDLKRVHGFPSIFAELDEWNYQTFKRQQELHVLRWFAHAIAEEVSRDIRSHVEYVPTQVLAEFFRTYEYFQQPQLEGIRFLSAKDKHGSNLVLFAGQEAIHGTTLSGQPENAGRAWILLTGVRDRVITP